MIGKNKKRITITLSNEAFKKLEKLIELYEDKTAKITFTKSEYLDNLIKRWYEEVEEGLKR